MDELTLVVQYVWNGIAIGAVYALIALGVTLVYGLSRIIHFAVGEMVMVCAFVAWSVQDLTGSFAIALVAAVAAGATIGLVTERLMFQFTYDAPLAGFVVSLGLIIFLQSLASEIWGVDTRTVRAPFQGVHEVGALVFRDQTLFNTALILVVMAVFYLGLSRSRWGRALRATADNREAAALMGIPVRRLTMMTFVIGAALAGIAGWVVLTLGAISPFVGGSYVLRGFAVALIGGLGNIKGAAVAGLGLGVAEALAIGYLDPGWSEAYVLGLVILVLLVRPTGLGAGAEGATL
ncbi:MAG: branched-chain amino acid transport system permease protein [Acidimicrobiaceae bacterium]